MAWQDWARLAISTLLVVSHGLKTALLAVLHVVSYVVVLATYPISWVWATLLFILTPVTHTIRFIFSPLTFIVNNFPRLQPIYIYFGSAAFVGIAFGLIFTLTSSGISSVLGLYESPDHRHQEEEEGPYYAAKRRPSPYIDDDDEGRGPRGDDDDDDRRAGSPPRLPDIEQESLEALLARLDSPDSDLGSLAGTAWRDGGPSSTKRKKRLAAALRIGTILEEDDDSL